MIANGTEALTKVYVYHEEQSVMLGNRKITLVMD